MKTLFWLGIIGAAIVLVSGTVCAAPSHLGPTGIVGTPTADVVGARQYDVAADYVEWDSDVKSWPIRLVAGVADKLEVGVGYTKWSDGGSIKITPVNVKAVVAPESGSSPAVAVGAGYGKIKDGVDIKITTLYAVATKTLSEAEDNYYDEGGMRGTVRGSLGIMYNKYSNGGSDSYTEPFASLEYLTPNGNTTLAVEYKTKENDMDAVSSLLVRHMVTPNTWVQLGWTNSFYSLGWDDHELFLGIGYRFAPQPEEEWYY